MVQVGNLSRSLLLCEHERLQVLMTVVGHP